MPGAARGHEAEARVKSSAGPSRSQVIEAAAQRGFARGAYGRVFNDYQSVRQGARDGARLAVVKDYGTNTSCGITTGSAATAPTNAEKMICSVK